MCHKCSELFVPSRNTKGLFCSRSCAVSYQNAVKPKRIKMERPPKSRRSLVEKYLDGDYNGTVKSGLSYVIREYVLQLRQHKCESCGFSGTNQTTGKTILTVDHIDGNSQNNVLNNLRVLCPNCHAQTPTYGALNKGNGRKARYQVVEV
jgi:5-methylcytosine-specific restriction endonuclease McrA